MKGRFLVIRLLVNPFCPEKEIKIRTLIAVFTIYNFNGNRTDWSPIPSVIIRGITKSDDRAATRTMFKINVASMRQEYIFGLCFAKGVYTLNGKIGL